MANKIQSAAQRDVIEKCRADSCLNRDIEIGATVPGHPEFGETVSAYYYRKHHGPNGPGPGRFYPLHTLAAAAWDRHHHVGGRYGPPPTMAQ